MCCPLLASFPRAIEQWSHRRAMVLVVTASELSLVKAGKRKVVGWRGGMGEARRGGAGVREGQICIRPAQRWLKLLKITFGNTEIF